MLNRWFTHCCLALLLSQAVEAATCALYIRNGTASQIVGNFNVQVTYNGANHHVRSTGTINAGATALTDGSSLSIPDGTVVAVKWIPGGSTNAPVYLPTSNADKATGDGFSFTVGPSGGNVFVWEVGGALPEVEYRFDLQVRNDTYTTQSYYVLTNGVLMQTTQLHPGDDFTISIQEVVELFPVAVNNGGVYPPFSSSFAATPGLFWTLQDDSNPVQLVPHQMQGSTFYPESPAVQALFDGLPGGTNAATDGSVQKGFGAMLGMSEQKANEQKELLTQIATNVSRMPTAAEVNAISNSGWSAIENTEAGFTMGTTVGNYGSGGTVPSVSWEFDFGLATVDLNPLTNTFIGPYADPLRNIMIWASAVGLVILCAKRTSDMMGELAAVSQASGPHLSVLGSGGNIITAGLAAVIILAMLGGASVLWTNFQAANTTVFALVGVDPMIYIPRIEPLLAFCPLDVMLAHFAIGLAYWLGITAAKWVLIVGIKIIPR